MAKKKLSNYSIAIDGNEANVNHRVGSNVYAFEVLKALEQVTCQISSIKVTVLLSSPPVADLPAERQGWIYRVIKPQPLWTQLALPIYLFLHATEYDVFYTPGHYAPRLSSIPYVSSVMDLGFLQFPDQFKKKDLTQLKTWTAYSVKHAAKVIAISQATKDDVVATYGRKASDVVVAFPSISAPPQPASELDIQEFMTAAGIRSPFVLYVGTLQPRKNLVRLVTAFEKVCSQWNLAKTRRKLKNSQSPQLVIAGKVGWLADDVLNTIAKSPFKSQIITTGYVSDQIKYPLYARASCSVLIGLYEGFGIPALESLSVGTVPVVANTTSLPEVVGQAGILVDPLSIESIAEGLLTALTLTAKQRGQYRREGRIQLQKFSWQATAQTILDTLLEVGSKK